MMHVSSTPFDPHFLCDLIQGVNLSEKRKESFETWLLLVIFLLSFPLGIWFSSCIRCAAGPNASVNPFTASLLAL